MNTLKQGLIRWLILTLAVLVATVLPGIHYDDYLSLAIAAFILGILNTFVRPLLTLLSLPFIIVTLGIFILIINSLLLLFTSWLVSGFHVDSFWSALFGSIIISLVNMFFGGNKDKKNSHRVAIKRKKSSSPRSSDPSGPRKPPPGKGPVIDI